MESGHFEQIETGLIRKIVRHVDMFVNVGANIGYYCCLAIKEGKRAIAFEPLDGNLRYFYRNMLANNWEDKVEVYPCALSDHIGIMPLYGGGTGASLIKGWAGQPEEPSMFVPVTTLDEVLADRVKGKTSLILVDVEGAEDDMLEGAARILTQSPKPIWLVEIAINEHQPRGLAINPRLLQTFSRFLDNGYQCLTADGCLRRVTKNDIARVIRDETDIIGTHNFIFAEDRVMDKIHDAGRIV
ncbi:MAG: FkbM family methyltransferase [Geobacteraceae bacterium]|nr:FkbM family methyltransferase [Geobacteraceae bacterium]